MAAAAAARRGLLRALVDHQAAAVNRGDAAALAGLLHKASASWRAPSLDGRYHDNSGSGTLAESLAEWGGLREARVLPTQVSNLG